MQTTYIPARYIDMDAVSIKSTKRYYIRINRNWGNWPAFEDAGLNDAIN